MSVETMRGTYARMPWVKVAALSLIIAIPAMLLGRVIWPPATGGPESTSAQLPFFIFESFFEALSLGLGVAFLVFGLPVVRQVESTWRLRAWLMYLSTGWLMVSWWSHGNLHISNSDNLQRLLYIEYGYHVTLVIAGAIIAYCFLSLMRERGGAASVR